MPEGPEVKIASDFLNDTFKNKKISKVEALTPYFREKYNDLISHLTRYLIGSSISSFTIGKKTFLKLQNNTYYQYHLGMTGGWVEKEHKHCHLIIGTENNNLYFSDIRKFGKHSIAMASTINEGVKKFDFLNSSYDKAAHLDYLKSKISINKNICCVLLDQRLFPGIGNYLKSEILYEASIHPESKWGHLSNKKIDMLLDIAFCITNESYDKGGAELKDFRNPFQNSCYKLNVYAKERDPDGMPVVSYKSKDQRTSWYVPSKQKL